MKALVTVILFMGLVACGSNTKDRVVAVKVGDKLYKPDRSAAMAIDTESKERIVCEKRIVTGSHRKERTCSTVNQKKQERRATRDTIDNNIDLYSRERLDNFGGGSGEGGG